MLEFIVELVVLAGLLFAVEPLDAASLFTALALSAVICTDVATISTVVLIFSGG